MSNYLIYGIIALIVVLILWFVITRLLKNRKPTVSKLELPFDISEIIIALKGKDNIKDLVANGSKITFFVIDDEGIDIDKLKKLGASGIVQTSGKITAIFGKLSSDIEMAIKEYQ